MSDTINNLSFEEAYEALEEALEALETGDISLKEAMALYERGLTLTKHCQQQLDAAELRLNQLLPDGSIEPVTPTA